MLTCVTLQTAVETRVFLIFNVVKIIFLPVFKLWTMLFLAFFDSFLPSFHDFLLQFKLPFYLDLIMQRLTLTCAVAPTRLTRRPYPVPVPVKVPASLSSV